MEDEDYFKFSDDVLINSTEKLYFYDTGLYIYSSTDGQLDLVADTEIQIAATTVDINGNVDISGTLTIGSAGISEAELEILDGATVTTTELNIIDGDTSATGTTVADADRVVYNDAGTMKQVAVTDLDTYVSGTTKTLTNKTLTSPVLNTGVSGTAIADEDDMSSNSATKLATQQSIKAYVDSEVGGAGSMSNFILEDDDGTEVTISNAKEVKFIGSGLTTNWTDTDNGTDADPYDMTFTVDAAQTGITSILATDLKIGEDDQTKIDFETADEIHFYAANVEQVYLADNIFGPQSDSDVDLGTTGVRWKDAYIDTITTTGAVTVGGDLTVNGTTTTVNSTTITVDDPIFTLGGDTAPGSDDNKDRGIEFRYHNGTAAKIGFFGWDDSATAFTFIPDATNSSEVFSGTVGNAVFGNITGTLATAAQTNITSVGALDGGSITSGFGAIDNGTSGIRTNTFTAETSILPDAVGGADLGSTSAEWGDVYIADDKKIYLGSDQNLSIEYDEDGNDTTAIVAAGGLSMAPHGTSAGNGTELRFQELAANGANYVGFKAPDTIAANKVFILPNADGSANQVLKTDGSLGLGWVDQAGGGTISLVADGSISAQKPVILTSAGKAAQVAVSGTTSNLTNGNYLGIAAESISDTATGTIVVPGGISEGHSSLTIGNHYFTNGEGTIGLVGSSTGEQYLGRAISATEIQLLENEGYLYSTAEGAITAGKPVQVDSDGEFSMIAETSTSYTAAVGTAVEYLDSDTILSSDVAYDSYRQKVILVTHPSSAGVLRIYVGTVTGGTTNSISFGSAQDIYTKNGDSVKVAYDSVSYQTMVTWVNSSNGRIDAVVITEDGDNTITAGSVTTTLEGSATDRRHDIINVGERKWVIVYRDNNDTYMKSRVLTTSGTTITAQTETAIKSETTVRYAVAYDATDSRLVYFRNEDTTSDLKAIGATLDGNSIGDLGTEATLNSGTNSLCNAGSAVYNKASDRFVVASRQLSNTGEIATMVLDTSDNSIGSVVNADFESGETCAGIQVLEEFDKVHICYGDRDDSTKGKLVDVTINSGTGAATFGTYQEFFANTLHFSNSPVDACVDLGICFDSTTKRFIVSYSDDATNDGYAVVGSLIGTGTTSNIATDGESYIGIATKTVVDNAQAEVATFGQIDAQQSGLTAGQKYFVQSDGSLATSADSSVPGYTGTVTTVAGKALSATKLLITE